jgi:hypothetical protein
MNPEIIPEGIKALIFRDKKDFYKASEVLYREHRQRANVSPGTDNKAGNSDIIAALQGQKEGFYYVMLMVPASFVPHIENLGIDYTALGKEEASRFLPQESKDFLRDNGGGLEHLC